MRRDKNATAQGGVPAHLTGGHTEPAGFTKRDLLLDNLLTRNRDPLDPTILAVVDPGKIRAMDCGAGLLADTEMIHEAGPIAQGWLRGVTVRQGYSVFLSDVSHLDRSDYFYESRDLLKLHCNLGGGSTISSGNDESECHPGSFSFLVQPDGSIKKEVAPPKVRSRAITMICTRDLLRDFLPGRNGLPSTILEYMRGSVAQFCHSDAPLPVPMQSIAEEMLNLRPGPMTDLMFEARALELLYMGLQQLAGWSAGPDLKPHHRRKVQQVRDLLHSTEGTSLGIGQISRAVAWNETQMMECFKQVTGMTISAYRQRLRMDEALAMLRTSQRSITEIALEAGYEHPGNFTTAFKRTFGFTPRAARSPCN